MKNEYKKLGEISDVTKLAGFEFSEYVKYSDSGEIIALRGLNIKNGKIVLDEIKFLDNSNLEKIKRSKLNVGDVLFTYVGTVGEVAIIEINDKFYLGPNVSRIRCREEIINPSYLKYFLMSSKFKKNQLYSLCASSSQKNITMSNIREFVIPVINIDKQEKIGCFFKEIDELIELKEKELSILEKKLYYYNNVFLSTKHNKCNCFLKDVCYEEKSNLTESRLNKDDIGNYNVIDGSLNFIGKTDDVSNDDYVALVKDGYVGKIKYMKKNTNVTSSLIRLKSDKINSISLFYTLRTINFNRYKEGSTIKHLYFKHIKNIPIYIPKNITEVSNILFELEEVISIKKDVIQLLKRKKLYYLNEIFC